MAETEQADLTTLTVQLLSAYVSNNSVPANELADLIATTRTALSGNAASEVAPAPEFEPAVSVRKSTASRDHLLSLIDGKPYKSLKRHLSTHGLTPAEYRERYKLPKDYPMVAPAYSEARREVAQRLGLGRRRAAAVAEADAAPAPAPVDAAPAPQVKIRGRKAMAKPATAVPEPVTPVAATVETPAIPEVPATTVESTGAVVRKRRTKAAAADAAAPTSNAEEKVASSKAGKGTKAKAAKPAPAKAKRPPEAPASAGSDPAEKKLARRPRKSTVSTSEASPAAEAAS